MPPKTETAVYRFYDGIFRFYEAANTFLTFGLDRYWRSLAVEKLKKACPEAKSVLDVCCGTGDLSFIIHLRFGGKLKVTGADQNEKMLCKAREKNPGLEFIQANALELPFPDKSFDAVTVSFALRNLNKDKSTLTAHLKEFRRILKDDGVFLNLETTRPRNRKIRSIMDRYVAIMTGILGAVCPESRPTYAFLKNSIRDFYGPDELSKIISESGFSRVSHKTLWPGATAIHIARK